MQINTYNKRAFIHEEYCVGCAICLKVCPFDAIVGAPNMSHTVIEDLCIGCDICIAPCPVNCIEVIHITEESILQKKEKINLAKKRYKSRKGRVNNYKNFEKKVHQELKDNLYVSKNKINKKVIDDAIKRAKNLE